MFVFVVDEVEKNAPVTVVPAIDLFQVPENSRQVVVVMVVVDSM